MSSPIPSTFEPLHNSNYPSWKVNAEALLCEKKLWKYVKGYHLLSSSSTSKAKHETDEGQGYDEDERRAAGLLILLCSKSVQQHISALHTAQERWDKLQQVSEKKRGNEWILFLSLMRQRLSGNNLEAHISTIL